MTKKRYRNPTAKPGELKVAYGRHEGNVGLVYTYGAGLRKGHTIAMIDAFERVSEVPWSRGQTLLDKLDADGFDITTLKITIQQKAGYEDR